MERRPRAKKNHEHVGGGDDRRKHVGEKKKPTFGMEALEPRILLSATWTGTEADDAFAGTDTADEAHGLGGDDVLHGADGDDTLFAGDGEDQLFGDLGNDTLDGGAGNDLLDGGDGDDVLIGRGGSDVMDGGTGDDTFRFDGAQDGDTYTVTGGAGGQDSIELAAYDNSQITDDGSSMTVDLGGGQSFTVNYSGVDSIVTAEGTYAPGGIPVTNAVPHATDDAVVTSEDQAVTTDDVLTNDTDGDGDTLSITGHTQGANGAVVYNNDGTFTYTPDPAFSGSDSFQYTVDDGNGNTDTATVNVQVNADGASATWDGEGGTDDASEAQNWSDDTTPDSNDELIFDSTSVESAEIDSGFGNTVAGVQLGNDYTGTVSLSHDLTVDGDLHISGGTLDLNGHQLTVTGDLIVDGGTLRIDGSEIQFTGSGDQVVTAGATAFDDVTINKPGGTLSLSEDATFGGDFVHTAGAVDASNVAVTFSGYNATIDAANVAFGNVTLNVGGTTNLAGDLHVEDLTIAGASSLNGGDIHVEGNIVTQDGSVGGNATVVIAGTGDQTISGPGELNHVTVNKPGGTLSLSEDATFGGDFVHTAGAVDASNVAVTFSGYNATIDAANVAFGNVTLNVGGTTNLAGDLHVEDLTIAGASSLNGGDIHVEGNIVTQDGSVGGNATVVIAGTGDQTISGPGELNHVTVNKPGGTLSLSEDATFGGDFVHTAGAVDASNVAVTFSGYNATIDAANVAFGNVTLNVGGTTNLAGDLHVEDLTIAGASSLNGGDIHVEGNIVTQDGSVGGNATVVIAGTGDQTISGPGELNHVTVNKPGGTLSLSEDATFGGDFVHTAGAVDASNVAVTFSGYNATIDAANVAFGNVTLNVGGTTNLAGDLHVEDLTIAGASSLNGGDIHVEGNIVTQDGSVGGNATVVIAGTGDQTISGPGELNHVTVNKPGGTLSLSEDATFGGDFVHTAGAVDASNVAVTFSGYNATIDAANVAFGNVTLNVGGTTNLAGDLHVEDLTIAGASSLNGGDIHVEGNIVTQDGSVGGNATVVIAGTGDQTISGPGELNHVTVNKPGGTLSLSEDATFGGDFVHTAGAVDASNVAVTFSGYNATIDAANVAFGNVTLNVGGTTNLAGDLHVEDLTIAGASSLNGGTIYVSQSLTDNDGNYGGSTSIVVTAPPNAAPGALADSFATTQDQPVTTGDVLANDSDPDDDPLSVTDHTQGTHGSVAYNDDGTFTYTPDAGFVGEDSFTYTVDDGNGNTSTAGVTVTVNPPPASTGRVVTEKSDGAVDIAEEPDIPQAADEVGDDEEPALIGSDVPEATGTIDGDADTGEPSDSNADDLVVDEGVTTDTAAGTDQADVPRDAALSFQDGASGETEWTEADLDALAVIDEDQRVDDDAADAGAFAESETEPIDRMSAPSAHESFGSYEEFELAESDGPGGEASLAASIAANAGATAAETFQSVDIDTTTMDYLPRSGSALATQEAGDRAVPDPDADEVHQRHDANRHSDASALAGGSAQAGGWLAGLWGLVRGVGRRHADERNASRRR